MALPAAVPAGSSQVLSTETAGIPGEISCGEARIRPDASFAIPNPPFSIFFGCGVAARRHCRTNDDSSFTPWRTTVNHSPGICWSRTKCREVGRPKTEQDPQGPVVSRARPAPASSSSIGPRPSRNGPPNPSATPSSLPRSSRASSAQMPSATPSPAAWLMACWPMSGRVEQASSLLLEFGRFLLDSAAWIV